MLYGVICVYIIDLCTLCENDKKMIKKNLFFRGSDGFYQKLLYPESKAGHHCLVINEFWRKYMTISEFFAKIKFGIVEWHILMVSEFDEKVLFHSIL